MFCIEFIIEFTEFIINAYRFYTMGNKNVATAAPLQDCHSGSAIAMVLLRRPAYNMAINGFERSIFCIRYNTITGNLQLNNRILGFST